MYILGLVLLIVLAIVCFIFAIVFIGDEIGAVPAFLCIIFSLGTWGYIEHRDYKQDQTQEISISDISIMSDDDVCVVRYGDKFQETYQKKSEYDAITDSTFTLYETKWYNIQGEYNGSIYEIKFDK
jgi:hypothetical protein